MLFAMLKDQRLEKLGWNSMLALASSVNKLSDRPAIDPKELNALTHPEKGKFDWNRKKGIDNHPAETEHVLKTLAEWRIKLREATIHWNRR